MECRSVLTAFERDASSERDDIFLHQSQSQAAAWADFGIESLEELENLGVAIFRDTDSIVGYCHVESSVFFPGFNSYKGLSAGFSELSGVGEQILDEDLKKSGNGPESFGEFVGCFESNRVLSQSCLKLSPTLLNALIYLNFSPVFLLNAGAGEGQETLDSCGQFGSESTGALNIRADFIVARFVQVLTTEFQQGCDRG